MQETAQSTTTRTSSGPRDLLDIILDARDSSVAADTDDMSISLVRDHSTTFMPAGHETTASLLGWLFYEACICPDVQEDMAMECKNEFDANMLNDVALSYGDISADHFEFVNKVIKETLRLHPPVGIHGRNCKVDTPIKRDLFNVVSKQEVREEWSVPAGSNAAFSIYGIHTNPKYWNKPMSFLPSRWDFPVEKFDSDALL